jgi:hypothetical protein
MLVAYGDDSSDAAKARVFAAATVVGRQAEWDEFGERWKAVNGDRPFHATDCDCDEGEFRRTDHRSNKELYARNVRLLASSPFIGSGIAISIADFEELFPGTVSEWPYYLCFASAVSRAAHIGRFSIPPEEVKVIFDRNFDREYNTGRLYDFMVKEERWTVSAYLGSEIAFADHRTTIGIQAADLIARETMKFLENRLAPNPRWTRQSLIELNKVRRFRFEFFGRGRLEALRKATDEITSHPAVDRVYRKWMAHKGLGDSLPTRLKFVNAPDAAEFEDDEVRALIQARVRPGTSDETGNIE